MTNLPESMVPKRSPLSRGDLILRTAAIVLAVGLLIALALSIPAVTRVVTQATTHEPERLTELYFSQPNSLPTTYTPGHLQTAAFTVHNVEYLPTDYEYTVTEATNDGKSSKPLANGSFSLDQNQITSVDPTVTPQNLGSRVQLQVKITFVGILSGATAPSPQSQVIDYWVNLVGPTK